MKIIGPDQPEKFWRPENFCPMTQVRSKSGAYVPFNLWDHQMILAKAVWECYANNKWLVHVKPRQEGSSTFFTNLAYQHAAYRPGCISAVVAHREETAKKLNAIALRFWRTTPKSIQTARNTQVRKYLEFPEIDSMMTIGSIMQDEPLRGDTVQFLLCTELSSWRDSRADAWQSVLNAVPDEHGMVVAESTPKYFGDQLHDVWSEAGKPGSRWHRVFIPWTKVPMYAKEPPVGWSPRPEVLDYANDRGLSIQQTFWMQIYGLPKCRNKFEIFKAEYPENDIECFGLAGEPVFDTQILLSWLKVLGADDGSIHETEEVAEFVEPAKHHRYIVAVDPASSWSKQDFFGIQILDLDTCEQVWEFQGHDTAGNMARRIAGIAKRYNNAQVYVEATGVGDAVLSQLVETVRYPNVWCRLSSDPMKRSRGEKIPGWYSTRQAKVSAISALQDFVETGALKIHSTRMIRQLIQYRGQWDRLGRRRTKTAGHYDLTAALSIAVWAYLRINGGVRPRSARDRNEVAKMAWNRIRSRVRAMEGEQWNTPWGQHR